MILFEASLSLAALRRQLLGNHLDPKEVSVMTYSRDCLAEPLRQLVNVLRDVRNAKFHPDLTRSGYKANPSGSASHEFVEEGCSSSREQSGGTSIVAHADEGKGTSVTNGDLIAAPVEAVKSAAAPVGWAASEGASANAHPVDDEAAASVGWTSDEASANAHPVSDGQGSDVVPVEDTVRSVSLLSDQSDSESDETGSVASAEAFGLPATGLPQAEPWFAVREPLMLVQHVKLKTVHVRWQSDARLLCGRIVASTYQEIGLSSDKFWSKCMQCFNSKDLETHQEPLNPP